MKKWLKILMVIAFTVNAGALFADDFEDSDYVKIKKEFDGKFAQYKQDEDLKKNAPDAFKMIEEYIEKAEKNAKKEEFNSATYYILKANVWLEILPMKRDLSNLEADCKTKTKSDCKI